MPVKRRRRRARLVLDTNVFVAAGFNPASSSARILDGARQGRWQIVWDEATRRETEKVLAQIPPLRRHEFSSLFREENRFTGPTYPQRFTAIADPDDLKFAALAAAARATLITNDEHLLSVRHQVDVDMATPGEFVARQAPLSTL